MTVEFTLADFQDDFVHGDAEAIAIIAGKGAGKTFSGALFVLNQIIEQPGSQGLVMLNTLQQTRDIYVQEIESKLKELNWQYSFNQQTMILKVFDCVIHLRSAEITAIEKIESVAYSWGWADEASFYEPKALETFVSRIRKGKALKRITSMPDEPDAFMYSFLEAYPFKLYELGLKDNPDREFADRYEKMLKATYAGAQLERFLSGKRVSLSGLGLFAVEPEMRKQGLSINADDDLLLSWDFNVEYRAVSAWQRIGHKEDGTLKVACVQSWQMKGSTVYEDAIDLSSMLRNHRGMIYLHGDASGQSRTAATTDSMWKTVKEVFYKTFGERIRFVVPASNPSVKDTIQCANWAFRNGLVDFNDAERNVYMSLQAARSDKYGEVDKSGDYKPTGIKSHECDTARYAIWHYYSQLYPGNRGGYFIV
jgi:hypothetical protein